MANLFSKKMLNAGLVSGGKLQDRLVPCFFNAAPSRGPSGNGTTCHDERFQLGFWCCVRFYLWHHLFAVLGGLIKFG